MDDKTSAENQQNKVTATVEKTFKENPTPSSVSALQPKFDYRFFLRLGFQILGICVVLIVVLVSLGALQKMGWIGGPGTAATAEKTDDQVYTCAMHPQIRQNGPGRCPICGMELIPATSNSANIDEYAVKILPAARRLANIQTTKAEQKIVYHTVETVGSIAIDESRMATIAVYVDGRIEKLFADYTGVKVAKDDHLSVLYSPNLYSAQVEYIQSQRALKEMGQGTLPIIRSTQEKLVANSRQKLIELGLTKEQLTELHTSGKAKSRLTIYAPIGGTVIEKLAVEGKYVKAGDPIYRIANLSTVWIMLELYPEDASLIRFGQRVEAEVQSIPGEFFKGRVAFIDPTVDPKTRTVGVRVEVLNLDGKLRPGDYASARIRIPIGAEGKVYDADLAGKWISPMHPQIILDKPGNCPICGMNLVPTERYGYSNKPVSQPKALVVPREAVLMAGDNSVLYVETEPGRFEIRPIVLGPIAKTTFETENGEPESRPVAVILEGVAEGEIVATSGNFLIDSQMQLAGNPSLIDPTRAIAHQKKESQKGPITDKHIHIEPLAGKRGQLVEQLYEAYFPIQGSLAADQKVSESQIKTLQTASQALLEDENLPENMVELINTISKNSEHLHHMELPKARQQFKPVSHSIVRLAFHFRGESAKQKFFHFHCPMVKGGGADWLQPNAKLLNPYFGSQMLNCGEKVHELPTVGHVATPENSKD